MLREFKVEANVGAPQVSYKETFRKAVDVEAGETKTVTIKLNVKDMYLFDETEQKDIVPTGTYTAYIGKNPDIMNVMHIRGRNDEILWRKCRTLFYDKRLADDYFSYGAKSGFPLWK